MYTDIFNVMEIKQSYRSGAKKKITMNPYDIYVPGLVHI